VASPKLSIVIPAYNEEAYLRRALRSIGRQSVAPDEVIVVDNNSTDRTAAIARSFKFVKLINEPIQGIAPTRDRGFNEATSELIGRIDADTELPRDWVKRAHELADSHAGEIFAITGMSHIYDVPVLPGRILAYWVMRVGFFRGSRLMLGHNALYGSNMVITKKAWRKVRGEVCTDNAVHEDVDLAVHVHRYGQVIFEPGWKVGVSKRGFVGESPLKVWRRLKAWQKNAVRHRSFAPAEAKAS
jgi:glycosyltransferase involved in cell wall biosynthesis